MPVEKVIFFFLVWEVKSEYWYVCVCACMCIHIYIYIYIYIYIGEF